MNAQYILVLILFSLLSTLGVACEQQVVHVPSVEDMEDKVEEGKESEEGEEDGDPDTEIELDKDGDYDKDGVLNNDDNCVALYNPDQFDIDTDGVGNRCDNCPNIANLSQEDGDRDGSGDLCDACPEHRAYATEAERDLCAAGEDYQFSLLGSSVIRQEEFYDRGIPLSTNFPYIRSIIHLGERLADGTPGAVLAMHLTNLFFQRADTHGQYDNNVVMLHLRPNLSTSYAFYISAQRDDQTRTRDNLKHGSEDSHERHFIHATADMGIHPVGNRDRRLLAIGESHRYAFDPPVGSTLSYTIPTVRLLELNPETAWRDPDAPHMSSLVGTHAYFLSANRTMQTIAYLGVVPYNGRSHHLFAVRHRPRDPRSTLPDRITFIYIDYLYLTETHRFDIESGDGVLPREILVAIPEYGSDDGAVMASNFSIFMNDDDDDTPRVGIHIYRLTPALGDKAVQEISIRTRTGQPILSSKAYQEMATTESSFGRDIHSLGDIDGDGPAAVTLAVGAPKADLTSFPDNAYPRGAVYLLHLSEIKSDEAGAPYVEFLGHDRISEQNPNGPRMAPDDIHFGEAITSFEMAGKKYLAVATGVPINIHLLEYR